MFKCFLRFTRQCTGSLSANGKKRKLLLTTGCATGITSFCSVSNCSNSVESNKNALYSIEDVENHDSVEKGLWVTYKGGVYDITKFVPNHPGGVDKLLLAGGRNLNDLWKLPQYRQHYKSPLAFELLEEMRIGTLESHNPNDSSAEVDYFKGDQLMYPSNHIYDCIIVGAGVSGLQCAFDLVRKHNIRNENILVLEAQDYVGGRVRQVQDFVKGVNIDVGAEFLHGSQTHLTKFARENNQSLKEIFCWAHGDGGPLPEAVNKGYGLYWIADENSDANTVKKRLIRYDAKDEDFVAMNDLLWGIAELNEEDFSDNDSLQDYLDTKPGLSEAMMNMAAGGFANTLCTNSRDLSLKQCIKWCRMWHEEVMYADFKMQIYSHIHFNLCLCVYCAL